MSSTASALPRFFFYAPRKTDAAAILEQDESIAQRHREGTAKNMKDGVIVVGGPLLSPESLTGGQETSVGSLAIFVAENIETVRKIVESDPFYTEGVWDAERVVILPFLAVTPFP
ncbi:hypothetical protein B0H11DRAFT_1951346 [Mycena galericulata]|nr:hypothetical protein B0H11DRAFT_1951346 [Mycena galericulata]